MLTKLRLFVKEHRMEILITVCVAFGTLFFGWFITLTSKPETPSTSWIILSIGLLFYMIALFCCYKIISKEARQETRAIEREKREIAREIHEIEREKREIERDKRDEERFLQTQHKTQLEVDKLEREKPYPGQGSL